MNARSLQFARTAGGMSARNSVSCSQLAGLVACLVALAPPSRAQTFCDADFATNDWTAAKIIDTSLPPGSFAVSQSVGGNPGNFRSIQHTYNAPGSGSSGSVLIEIAHLRNGFIYSPPVCGKILSIDYQWDLINTSLPGLNVAYHLLIYQSNAFYSGPNDQILPTGLWTSLNQTGLVETDFTKIEGNPIAPLNPDFSCTGAPIQLGFISANSIPSASSTYTVVTNSGVDNWCVTLHVQPCSGPCAETNPVPNWSFEIRTSCPAAPGMSSLATPWYSPTQATSEYFHTCGVGGFGVPANLVGSQVPRTGDAYAGIVAYVPSSPNYRSYLEVALSSPLVAHRLYDVSFWVSLADSSQFGCDGIAGLLSVGPVGPLNTTTALSLAPYLYTPQIVGPAGAPLVDTAGWTRVHHAYKANGGEDHLVIGSFLADSQTTTANVIGGTFPLAYYYVDDVSICEADPDCICGAPSWSDALDSYATGSIAEGQGGWTAGWDNCGSASLITAQHQISAPNSVAVIPHSDLMQIFSGYTAGKWTFRTMQYLASAGQSDASRPSHFRLLHEYNGPCTMFLDAHQSVHIEFDTPALQWHLFQGCLVVASGPLYFDQWVELRSEIDLTADTVETFYGGVSMAPPASWKSAAACPFGVGASEIAALKLTDYDASSSGSGTYYDCMSLTPYKAPVTVNVISCGLGCLALTPKSAPVLPNDVVVGKLPNGLAHSVDTGPRVASYAIVAFTDRNPTTGASVTYTPISPFGGPDTELCVTLLPSLSGTYPYQAEIIDQNFDLLYEIDPELVAGTGFTSLCDPGVGGVIACPCGNLPGSPGRGCDNSSGTGGAILSASGVAYLSHDTLVFTTSGEKPTATSIVMQGNSLLANGVVFGQGVRCVGGTLKRLYTKTAVAGSITAPNFGAGDPAVSIRSATLGDPISAGQSRWYLVYYRDPIVLGGCPAANTFNATQTVRIDWSL